MNSFDSLGIEPKLLRALKDFGVSVPTPIQAQAIPEAIQGKDVIGIAQTGTGKTIAFGVPMLQQLMSDKRPGLVLVPTRELALQVDETIGRLAGDLGMRTAVLIGGANMRTQVAAVRRSPHIVIATPGRLIDHLEQGTIRLGRVGVLVLDEADRMLDMGFQPQIRRILEEVPQDRQTMLFSATLSGDIAAIATKHMRTPISIEVAPQGTTAEKVTQEFFLVNRDQKLPLLEAVLQKYTGSTLVFIRTKHGAKKLVDLLKRSGHNVAEIHGNRSLGQRKQALEGFKKGTYRILVATDIASRGIDVKGIELVINFDLPMDSADYVHRIGRTARAGADGHAISFATPQERNGVRGIERLIRQTVSFSPLPEHLPSPRMEFRQPEQRGGRPSRGSYGGQRGGYGRSGGNRGRTSNGNRSNSREYIHDSSAVTAENFQVRTGAGRRFGRRR